MASERITPSDRQGIFSNSLNSSVLDPEQLMDGVRLAMFHIENGERSFEAYVKVMNEEFDGYGPFLLMWYNAVREYPGFDPRGMTPRDKITPKLLQRLGVDTPPRKEETSAQEPEPAGTPTESHIQVTDRRPATRPRDGAAPQWARERLFRLFGIREKVHRDRAVELFVAHIHTEALTLRRRIISHLSEYCDGADGRPTLDSVYNRPIVSFDDGEFDIYKKGLLDAHCFAVAAAVGLDSALCSVFPHSQRKVVIFMTNKAIVEEDVGVSQIGRTPSSRPHPDVHILYAPGTFVGGVLSQQQKLVRLYQSLKDNNARLAMFLISLRVFLPEDGVSKVLYRENPLGYGISGLNRIGLERPINSQLDEWEENLKITDPIVALSPLPGKIVRNMMSVIGAIDPFWPEYCRRHCLTW